ncbi:hypothetical protein GCM10020295_56950 [Streptomyces cinereospinus]
MSRAKLQIGAVGHNQLAIGTGNLMPDPSFEGAFTAQLVAANSQWTLVGGNGSPKALRVNGTSATAASPSLRITELPVSPGNRFFLAFDYRVSADWAGNSVRFYLRWQDAAGAVLGYGTAIATPTPGAAWARVSQQVQAPAGTVAATVWLQDFQATAGTADFDNAEIRTVIGAGMVLAESIGTLELAAQSVTGEKVVAKSLTAREVKALSLTGDEIATNTLTARHIAAGSLSASRLAIGTNGNLVGDPPTKPAWSQPVWLARTRRSSPSRTEATTPPSGCASPRPPGRTAGSSTPPRPCCPVTVTGSPPTTRPPQTSPGPP